MKVQAVFYIERDEEIELHVFGDAEPLIPANFSGYPDKHTPPEGGEIGIHGIFLDEDGDEPWGGELTAEETTDAEAHLADALEEAIQRNEEDAAVAKAESMADDVRYADEMFDKDCGPYGPDIYDF